MDGTAQLPLVGGSPPTEVCVVVKWCPADVMTLKEGMTEEQAAEWLRKNGKYVKQEMVISGWKIIESML